MMETLRNFFVQVRRYPSAVAGLLVVAALLGLALFALIAIPYQQALDLWRGGEPWQQHPMNASPAWSNWFRATNLPPTLRSESRIADIAEEPFEGGRVFTIPIDVEYSFEAFPSEMNLFVRADFVEREPFVRMTWHTPDGREIPMGGRRVSRAERVSFSQDWGLERRLGGLPHVELFAEPEREAQPRVLPGRYRLEIEAIMFEPDATLEATLVTYGRVHGLAGTDHQRRDLIVSLLWGTPVALAFGLLAAVGTTITTLVIAAVGVWYAGWVDALIQRLTEVNMILPLLPILILVGTLYTTSIWVMLGIVVLLGIFSAGIKVYRAMLLPIRESPYIEAARSYGASNSRIVLRYMIPRILPVLIPNFVTLIPSFVFLEASLAVLGLGDPVLPTWGKVMNDALQEGALYHGYYYWVLGPAVLLMLTGLGFAMLGFALDRIFNPRLRMI
jgi:peptide/nickel transport system permease protein